MKIDEIEVFHVKMPLVRPYRVSFGKEAVVESILVRMSSGGQNGWGESCPLGEPVYSGEYAGGVFAVITKFLAPLLLGQDVRSGAQLQGLLGRFRGNRFAKAGLDHAWWDLHARMAGVPLWQAIGGQHGTVDVGAAFGIQDSIDELLRLIGGAVEAGFKRVKLKCAPGWDVDMLAAVRKAFPDATIHVDCNSVYTLADLDTLKKFDAFDLAMIEQPLDHDDLIDHATLQQKIATPICLDESVVSLDTARKAIQIGSCRWVNIKPPRVGGLTEAVAIHDLCRDAGIGCWVGGMLESALGEYLCLALATLDNIKYPSDISASDRFYCPDLSEPPVVLSAPSQVTALDAPGLGSNPNPDRLAAQTVSKARLSN